MLGEEILHSLNGWEREFANGDVADCSGLHFFQIGLVFGNALLGLPVLSNNLMLAAVDIGLVGLPILLGRSQFANLLLDLVLQHSVLRAGELCGNVAEQVLVLLQ